MSAADEAYAYTKGRILGGDFPGGEMISEGDVAGPTGLSRTPVREAFLRLEAEGLLRLYPKRGALVVPVSPREVEAVMEARQLVELHGLELAVKGPTTTTDQLEAAIARQESLVAAGDTSGFVDADREFHRVLVAATGNTILIELHDSMRDRQTRMGLTALGRDKDRIESIIAEHRGILEAVEDADAAKAKRLLRQHLQRTLDLLRNVQQEAR